MSNYNQKSKYIALLSQEYIKNSMKVQERLENYLEKLQITNTKTGEVFPLRSDFQNTSRDNYLWLVFQSIYMQNKMVEAGKVAVFLTLTLPISYHPFHFKSKKKNRAFDPLRNGGKLLTNAFRSVYNDFKINRKRVKLHYQRVIEPHKSFVPHLHALIYLDPCDVLPFQKHVLNQIRNHGLGSQYDFTPIKDVKKSAAYLLKYIKKNLSGDDLTTSHLISGWKRDNNIRIYTYTQMSLPKFIFQKLSRVLKLKVNEGENILEEIERLVDVTVNYKELYNDRQKNYIATSSKYRAIIDIEIQKKLVLEDKNIDLHIADMRINNKFDVKWHTENTSEDIKGHYSIEEFFRYVHSLDDIENDLIYFDPSTFNYQVYFSTWSIPDLIDLFELYTRGFESKIVKTYHLREFIIYEGEETLYKKSDFVLY